MKNKISLLFFVVLVSVSFTGCSFMNRSKQQDIASWQMSKVNPELFNKRNLEYLQKNTTINPVLYASSSVYSGDVSGDEENEIVVISKDTIYIYNLAGNLLQEKTFEDMKFGGGILADIDEDSKLDIILGAAEEKGVRIFGYSGVLEPVIDFFHSKMYNAETKIHFFHDNNIYFSAFSSLAIPPKIVGAYNAEKEILSWEYFTGPAPLDIAANKDFTKITISNTPKSANGLVMNERNVSDHSKYNNSIYVLSDGGSVTTQLSVGPEYRVGKFTEGGISSITERFCNLDSDGEEELLVGINRISEFYKGNAAIEVRSLEGEVQNRREFLPNTEIEYSFYDTGRGMEIAVLLKQQGHFYILDKDLEIKRKWESSGIKGEGTLHESGDFNGDGRMEHLLSIGSRLYILDSRLEVIYSTALETVVLKALITAGSSGAPVLAVQSDSIDFYRIGEEKYGSVSVFTNPPGADVLLNGKPLDILPVSGLLSSIPAGKITFQSQMGEYKSNKLTVKIKTGQHYTVDLKLENYFEGPEPPVHQDRDIVPIPAPEIPVSEWKDIHLVTKMPKSETLIYHRYQDLAGDERKDFLFYEKENKTYRTYSSSMEILAEFRLPPGYYRGNVQKSWPDYEENGKAAIIIFKRNEQEFSFYSAEGKVLNYKILGRFPDSNFHSSPIYNEKTLFLSINSGYAQQPRGIFGIDTSENQISFFYPTAAAPIGLLLTQEDILLTQIHTPSNDGEVIYPNGMIARDSEYFIYMTDLEGNHLDKSFNPHFEGNNGYTYYYMTDLDHDEEKEVYLIANKTNYYTGRSRIVKLDMKKGIVSDTLFSRGTDTSLYLHSELKQANKPILATYLRKPRELYLLSQNFELLKTYNMTDKGFPSYWLFPDLNADGTSEMFLWNENGLFIHDLEFNLLFSIETDKESGPLRNVIIDDTDNNGKDEIILITYNTVSVYSY